MRIHRFYVTESVSNSFSIGDTISVRSLPLVHQWKNVFRFGRGDEIIIFNGISGEQYRVRFSELTSKEANLEILEKQNGFGSPSREVTLYSALIKKERFEWMVEKATEIGVSHFCPLITERIKMETLKIERAQKIIIEATEQSGWCRVPTIVEPLSLSVALDQAKNPFVCDVGEPAARVLPKTADLSEISLFIGPEGGWSVAERELFAQKKIPTISLGRQTLRAETAALVAAAFTLLP